MPAKVIFIDDEESMLELIKEILEDGGDIEVVTEANSLKAIERLEQESFDVIICDYQMPSKNGIEVLRELRGHGNTTPFIMFTARGKDEVEPDPLKAGADVYIQKQAGSRAVFVELRDAVTHLACVRDDVIAPSKRDPLTVLKSTIDSLPIGVMAIGMDGGLIMYNHRLLEDWGIDEDLMLIGRTEYLSAMLYKVTKPDILLNQFMEVRTDPMSPDCGSVIMKDGRIMAISTNPLIQEGKLIGRVMAFRHISNKSLPPTSVGPDELESILGHSGTVAIVWRADPQWSVAYVSDNIERYGYDAKELISGKLSFCDMIHPDDYARVKSEVGEFVGCDSPMFIQEYRILTKGGQVRYLRDETYARKAPDGTISHYQGILTDLTEIRMQEQYLRENQTLMRSIIEASTIGMALCDFNGRPMFTNQAAQTLFGYTNEELRTLRPPQFVHPDDVWNDQTQMESLQRGELDHYEVTKRYIRKDGTQFIGRLKVSVVKSDPSGERMYLRMVEDITTEVQAQEAIWQAEQRSRHIIEGATELVLTIDLGGRITSLNKATETFLGWSSAEVMSTNIFEYLPPESAPIGRKAMMAKMLGETDHTNYEIEVRRRDGQSRVLEVNSATMQENGRVIGVQIIARDVTQRVKAEEAMRIANRKISLLGDVTRHDVLNMVSVLSSYMQFAEKNNVDPKVADYLKKAHQAMNHIQEQMVFTRQYQALGTAQPAWFSVSEVWGNAIEEVDLQGAQCGSELGGLELFADPMIGSVVMNLLSNSIKHGGHVTFVSLTYDVIDEGVRVVYEDDGKGVSELEKERIFDWGHKGRSGHGLHFIREILHITGLEIRETGKPGNGARFEITVPVGKFRFQEKLMSEQSIEGGVDHRLMIPR
jgi:PAS domain S-box-containing protein